MCVKREQGRVLTSLKRKAKPMTRGLGGRKFFWPLIMKDPTVRYSPVGAVLETCSQQHALSATAGYVMSVTCSQPTMLCSLPNIRCKSSN